MKIANKQILITFSVFIPILFTVLAITNFDKKPAAKIDQVWENSTLNRYNFPEYETILLNVLSGDEIQSFVLQTKGVDKIDLSIGNETYTVHYSRGEIHLRSAVRKHIFHLGQRELNDKEKTTTTTEHIVYGIAQYNTPIVVDEFESMLLFQNNFDSNKQCNSGGIGAEGCGIPLCNINCSTGYHACCADELTGCFCKEY